MTDSRLSEVLFQFRRPAEQNDSRPRLRIQEQLMIDASGWGDVIRLSGAVYDYGPDLKEKYDEPLAPESRQGYPVTDLNSITYCMVLVETDEHKPISRPAGYDP